MLSVAAKRFQPVGLGENVSFPVPEVDRGRSDFRNSNGVITSAGEDGNYAIDWHKTWYFKTKFCPITIHSYQRIVSKYKRRPREEGYSARSYRQ